MKCTSPHCDVIYKQRIVFAHSIYGRPMGGGGQNENGTLYMYIL